MERTETTAMMSTMSSLSEFKNEWKSIQKLIERPIGTAVAIPKGQTSDGTKCDRFDCSGLALEYIHDQTDRISEDFARRWKTLDHRKIVVDGERPRWYQRRVRLPENFRLDREPDDTPETDERVVNLDNPLDTLSYSSELWKLFEKIPSADELDRKTFDGQCLPRTTALVGRDDRQSRKRLRLSQCHDAPLRTAGPFVAAIRLECWKNKPALDNLPDRNRLVLEFSESQTLLDVHETLVLMAATNKGDEREMSVNGFFFIESQVYVSDETASVKAIVEWLKSDSKRLLDLGLDNSCTSAQVKYMAATSLADLRCRLGVRYCHQSSSSFETAIFVTDFRMPVKPALVNQQPGQQQRRVHLGTELYVEHAVNL